MTVDTNIKSGDDSTEEEEDDIFADDEEDTVTLKNCTVTEDSDEEEEENKTLMNEGSVNTKGVRGTDEGFTNNRVGAMTLKNGMVTHNLLDEELEEQIVTNEGYIKHSEGCVRNCEELGTPNEEHTNNRDNTDSRVDAEALKNYTPTEDMVTNDEEGGSTEGYAKNDNDHGENGECSNNNGERNSLDTGGVDDTASMNNNETTDACDDQDLRETEVEKRKTKVIMRLSIYCPAL